MVKYAGRSLLLGSLMLFGCSSSSSTPGGGDGGADVRAEVDQTVNRPDFSHDADSGSGCHSTEDCLGKVPLDVCEVPSCDLATGACSAVVAPDGTACSDGDACTSPDQCMAGQCVSEPWCECQDNEFCFTTHDDGNSCNGYYYCDKTQMPWTCQPKPDSEIRCPPIGNDPCLQNICQPDSGQCALRPVNIGQACEDFNVCTQNTQCNEQGQCEGELVCECESDADCFAFENGDACDGHLFCDLSEFPFHCKTEPGSAISCTTAADTPCTKNTCQPASGLCRMEPLANESACDDENPCTVGDRCLQGACEPAEFNACDDENPCTNDGCSPVTGCQHVANMDPCPQVNLCFVGNQCSNGQCRFGTPINCNDGIDCTADSCVVTEGCRHLQNDAPCDDADPCTLDHCVIDQGCLHDWDSTSCPATDTAGQDTVEAAPDVAADIGQDIAPEVMPVDQATDMTVPDIGEDLPPQEDLVPIDVTPADTATDQGQPALCPVGEVAVTFLVDTSIRADFVNLLALVESGEQVYITGSGPALGNWGERDGWWDPQMAEFAMTDLGGGFFSKMICLPAGAALEYKFLKSSNDPADPWGNVMKDYRSKADSPCINAMSELTAEQYDAMTGGLYETGNLLWSVPTESPAADAPTEAIMAWRNFAWLTYGYYHSCE